ncbi:MAG TPA: hypothetical protein VFU57_06435 [Candidatus Acidoferrales bacterium]|nr:hypothetical protein [Candidatus Acidoferrales bacterium]
MEEIGPYKDDGKYHADADARKKPQTFGKATKVCATKPTTERPAEGGRHEKAKKPHVSRERRGGT